jgi:ABC-type Fe3+-hydroxamate transport system substrate-binding protein
VQYGSASAGKTGTFVQIAPEQLDQVGDSDLLLYGVGSDGKPSEAQQALLDQPVFKALPAAREGRIFPMTTLFPTSYGAALVFLDEIEGVLKKLA